MQRWFAKLNLEGRWNSLA